MHIKEYNFYLTGGNFTKLQVSVFFCKNAVIIEVKNKIKSFAKGTEPDFYMCYHETSK